MGYRTTDLRKDDSRSYSEGAAGVTVVRNMEYADERRSIDAADG